MTSFPKTNDGGIADPFALAQQENFVSSPSKKARTDDSAPCYDDAPFGETMKESSNAQDNVTLMTEDSLQAPYEQEPPAITAEDSSNLQPSEEDKAWEAVVQQIQSSDPNSVSYQHLQAFIDGVERRQAALQRMEGVFQQVEASLDQIITQQLLGNVADMHGHMFDNMELLEKDIQHHLIQNHERRQAFTSRVEQWNATMQSNYKSLLHRVRSGGEETDVQVPDMNETNDLTGGMNPDSTNGGEDGTAQEEEFNWDELLQNETSRDNAHAFLQGRDQWITAQDRFGAALDEVHANLKSIVNNVLRSIVDAIDEMNDSMEAQLIDIRNHLGSNFERREFLERAVAEAAQRQQSMFSKLKDRISSTPMFSNLMNFGRGKPDNEMK